MQLMHRVALAGVQLDEVDRRVIVQGVRCAGGKTSVSAVSLYGRDGQRVTSSQRDTMDIEVSFGLLIRKNDMAARAALLEAINTWAAQALKENGGAWLTVNYKEGRQAHVYLEAPAEEGDLKDWDNTFRITFRAYGVPYWQETSPASFESRAGIGVSELVTVGGNVRTVASARLDNISGSMINTCSVTVGDYTMHFVDLALDGDEALVIDHTAEGRLRIRIRNTAGKYRSALAKRTPGSADDFYLTPGDHIASFTAQRACTLTVTACGRYL